jgi:hypothetical protein
MFNFDFKAHYLSESPKNDVHQAIEKAIEKAHLGNFKVCLTLTGKVLVLSEISVLMRDDIVEIVYDTDKGYIFSSNAIYLTLFGSATTECTVEFSFRVGDKALSASGKWVKLTFVLAFKLVKFIGKYLSKLLMKNKPEEVMIKPIVAVTQLEPQYMRNNNSVQSSKR